MTSRAAEHDKHDWTVRGLRLPEPFIALLTAGLWRDPQEWALRALMPWFEDPLILLAKPRVVASDFWTNPQQCAWRTVAPTFTDLAARLQRG